jgi:hypothetical protein
MMKRETPFLVLLTLTLVTEFRLTSTVVLVVVQFIACITGTLVPNLLLGTVVVAHLEVGTVRFPANLF